MKLGCDINTNSRWVGIWLHDDNWIIGIISKYWLVVILAAVSTNVENCRCVL